MTPEATARVRGKPEIMHPDDPFQGVFTQEWLTAVTPMIDALIVLSLICLVVMIDHMMDGRSPE